MPQQRTPRRYRNERPRVHCVRVPLGGIAPPHQASETQVTIYVQRQMVRSVGIEPTTGDL